MNGKRAGFVPALSTALPLPIASVTLTRDALLLGIFPHIMERLTSSDAENCPFSAVAPPAPSLLRPALRLRDRPRSALLLFPIILLLGTRLTTLVAAFFSRFAGLIPWLTFRHDISAMSVDSARPLAMFLFLPGDTVTAVTGAMGASPAHGRTSSLRSA